VIERVPPDKEVVTAMSWRDSRNSKRRRARRRWRLDDVFIVARYCLSANGQATSVMPIGRAGFGYLMLVIMAAGEKKFKNGVD
jgi:hypothetical protein